MKTQHSEPSYGQSREHEARPNAKVTVDTAPYPFRNPDLSVKRGSAVLQGRVQHRQRDPLPRSSLVEGAHHHKVGRGRDYLQ